mmetsp:Transcript_19477/g.30952  ORF Transcript_19477/g.30952 Transcript_19477/m.30952 type:complete len:212 (+) Transcript_19477:131-766(+)
MLDLLNYNVCHCFGKFQLNRWRIIVALFVIRAATMTVSTHSTTRWRRCRAMAFYSRLHVLLLIDSTLHCDYLLLFERLRLLFVTMTILDCFAIFQPILWRIREALFVLRHLHLLSLSPLLLLLFDGDDDRDDHDGDTQQSGACQYPHHRNSNRMLGAIVPFNHVFRIQIGVDRRVHVLGQLGYVGVAHDGDVDADIVRTCGRLRRQYRWRQ